MMFEPCLSVLEKVKMGCIDSKQHLEIVWNLLMRKKKAA